jgi:hypothetical protein
VPIIGQQVLMTAVLGGRSLNPLSFVVGALATLLVAVVLVRMTTGLFTREGIIFSR